LTLSVAASLAVCGLVAYILATHIDDMESAFNRLTLPDLVLVVVLSAVSLVARVEVLVQGLAAMGRPPRRATIHAASSLTLVVMTANHYISSPVRAVLLKRTDPERAPTMPEMIAVDTATTMIEAVLVVGLIVVCALTLRLPWWVAPLSATAVALGLTTAIFTHGRFGHWPGVRGLAVLEHQRRRLAIAGLLVIVITCQLARTLLVLRVVGLHPSALQVVETFLSGGLLSSLFAGPTAGAAGAPLLVFGRRSIGAAGAAGLLLSATVILAALLYAAVGSPAYLKQLASERSRRGPELSAPN
jgi:hypothetical protein